MTRNDYAARTCATRFGTSLLLLILTAAAPSAQAFQAKPDAAPQFEAAAIKPSNPAFRPGRLAIFPVVTPPGRLIVENATLKDLIAAAWSLQAYQITGGAAWIGSTRFDVEGSPLKDGEWKGASPVNYARFNDIPALAGFVMRMGSDKPVVDKTGLKGNLAIDLDMSKIQELAAQGYPDGAPTNEAMYDALTAILQDTLGLKLVSTKTRGDVFAIDHAEKVTENQRSICRRT